MSKYRHIKSGEPMRISQMLSTLNGLFLSSNVVAATLLSPYVDFTLNTHWDSQTQQTAYNVQQFLKGLYGILLKLLQ
jgi:hypothetical protein